MKTATILFLVLAIAFVIQDVSANRRKGQFCGGRRSPNRFRCQPGLTCKFVSRSRQECQPGGAPHPQPRPHPSPRSHPKPRPPVHSPPSAGGNWNGNLNTPRQMTRVSRDAGDGRAMMKGKGRIQIGGGSLTMSGKNPRYYVHGNWGNVEMEADVKLVRAPSKRQSYCGFTMVARSNHQNSGSNGCEARGYYARYWFRDSERRGENVGFQKEYEHGRSIVYSNSFRKRSPFGSVNVGQWYKMTFRVRNEGSNVRLELFINGKIVNSMLDTTGAMPPTKRTGCNARRDPFRNNGGVSFFRTDCDAVVQWKNMKIRNI